VRRRIAAVRSLTALALLSAGLTAFAVAATTPATTAGKPAATKPATKTATAKPSTGTGTHKPGTTPATKKTAAKPGRPPIEQAFAARQLEDEGAYGRAADELKVLRKMVKIDGDLELELALDEARSGRSDSALARLSTPLMEAAANDSMPLKRRAEYPYQRETFWVDGKFEGWNWYILRARAELEARRGHWKEATAWARRTTDAWVLNGKDWHILAVCAAHAGQEDLARQATAQAILLDPTLPEARYLAGLWAWRDGRRNEAIEHFRRAVYLDSAYAAPALAMMKVRLPGAQPDTLPTELLTGIHQAALLTSSERPKPEEFEQMDTPASLESAPDTAVTDTITPGVKSYKLYVSVLLDENGLPVLNQLPWYPPAVLDFRKVLRILNSVPGMRFKPATRLSRPVRIWISLDYDLKP
jgi:tetratricopeptide (TPR) repeat protein